MTRDQKLELWNSLSPAGKEEFKNNLDKMKLLIERFKLVPEAQSDLVERVLSGKTVKRTQGAGNSSRTKKKSTPTSGEFYKP